MPRHRFRNRDPCWPKSGSPEQVTLWADVAERCRRQLRSQVVLVTGVVSHYDGTPNIIVSDLRAIDTRVRMPEAHDWH